MSRDIIQELQNRITELEAEVERLKALFVERDAITARRLDSLLERWPGKFAGERVSFGAFALARLSEGSGQ